MLLWIGLPALLLRLEWRARREPEYGERIPERLGRVPLHIPPGCLWIHAVSAGETIAIAPLIAQLVSKCSGDAGMPFLVTAMTPSGSAQVRARLGGTVHHCYAPYDYPFAVRTFFDAVQPRLLVLVETELWPNTIAEAHRRGVPVLLINARLSECSAQGYRRLGGLVRRMLARIDAVACQTQAQLERFQNLGLASDRGSVIGSIKFDAKLTQDHDERVAALGRDLNLGQHPVWIAGSTHPGEDEFVLRAHAHICERHPKAILLLVPRHPIRATELCVLARRSGCTPSLAGVPMPTASSTDGTGEPYLTGSAAGKLAAPPPKALVIIWNSLGQLQTLYGLAQIAFLGGSLVPAGGHNPIEAALCGQPLVMGPHTWNFDEVVAAFEAADCLTRVATAEQLADAVSAGFADAAGRIAAGERARQVVRENRGASERLLDLLGNYISASRLRSEAFRVTGADESVKRLSSVKSSSASVPEVCLSRIKSMT